MIIYLILFLALCLLVSNVIYTRLKINKLTAEISKYKKEIEQSDSVKDRIFRAVSHDMRSSVNTLTTFNQLLENDEIPPDKHSIYTGELRKILQQNFLLMGNLFSWGASHMEDFIQNTERFDIQLKANEVIDSLHSSSAVKNISIENNIPHGTFVSADKPMTALILKNLLANAIKYTPDNGKIELYSEYSGSNVSMFVQDTGIGMTEKSVEQFNTCSHLQFVKSIPGTNKEKGTGLGLILCKTFAKQMKGNISVKSELDKGTIFCVQLPA